MKHERRIPAWLLCDLSALGQMIAHLWLLVVELIREGFRLARGAQPRPWKTSRIPHLLLNAEASLAFALWREACRRLGYNPRHVKRELADFPDDLNELEARMISYFDQIQNLSRAAAHYTELLRQQIGAASPGAHGSARARQRRATRLESAGAASSFHKPAIAFMASRRFARARRTMRACFPPPAARPHCLLPIADRPLPQRPRV